MRIKCLAYVTFMVLLPALVMTRVLPQPIHKYLRIASFNKPLRMLDNDYEITDFENTALRKSRFGKIPIYVIRKRRGKDRSASLESLFDRNGGKIFLTKPRGSNSLSDKLDDTKKLWSEWKHMRRAVDINDSEPIINTKSNLIPKTVFDFADLVT